MTENVRAALALVARGEAKLGIVYTTDAKAEPKVEVAGIFPEDSHPPIIYPVALTTAGTNPDAASSSPSSHRRKPRDFQGAGFHDPAIGTDWVHFSRGMDRNTSEFAGGQCRDSRVAAVSA